MKKIKLFLVILSTVNMSCSPQSSEVVEGIWAIDSVYFGEDDIMNNIVMNVLSFKKDGIFGVPINIDVINYNKKDMYGKWFIDDKSKLHLESKNPYFNGVFDFCFKKDMEKQLLKIIISSDQFYMEASKFLTDMDSIPDLPNQCGEHL